MFRLYGRGSDGRSTAGDDDSTVLELQQRLHEKDMKLTDTQLEALSSAAQLEQLREAMNKMKVRDYGERDVSVADRNRDIFTTPVAYSLYMYGIHVLDCCVLVAVPSILDVHVLYNVHGNTKSTRVVPVFSWR